MIVNLRGTNGSGKSTIVRKLMEKYPERDPVHINGRKQPVGYFCYRDNGKTLWVIGHYETACGGCDTIPTVEDVYTLIRRRAADCDVIYEGLLVESDTTRAIQLSKDFPPFMIVLLSTTLEECQKAIQARRDERGTTKDFNRELTPEEFAALSSTKKKFLRQGVPYGMLNPAIKHDAVHRLHPPKFKEAGVDHRLLSREEAMKTVLEAFGWNA